MQRLAALIGTLMLAVMLWTGTAARAADLAGCIEVTAESAGHFEGDGDQVPSDPDKGTPHHHGGCHGHHVAVPSDGDAASLAVDLSGSVGLRLATMTAGCDPGTALRPPIA